MVDRVNQAEPESGVAIFAAKGAIGVEHETQFQLTGVLLVHLVRVDAFEIVSGRGREPEFCANEVLENGSVVAADGAVCFVGYDELEIVRRELRQVAVAGGQALNGCDDHLSFHPVVAAFFVDDGGDAVFGQVLVEIAPGLILQLDTVHEEEDAGRVGGPDEEFGDGRAQEGLARAGGHFKEKAVFAFGVGPLHGARRVHLVVAQELDVLVDSNDVALRGRIREPGGVLGHSDEVLVYFKVDQLLGVGVPSRRFAKLVEGEKMGQTCRVGLGEIPVIVNDAVGEENVADTECFGVVPGLFLAVQRREAFALGFAPRRSTRSESCGA